MILLLLFYYLSGWALFLADSDTDSAVTEVPAEDSVTFRGPSCAEGAPQAALPVEFVLVLGREKRRGSRIAVSPSPVPPRAAGARWRLP